MIVRILKKIFTRIRKILFPSLQDRELIRWYRDDGDNQKRFDYVVSSDSIIIDLGGYDGNWASDFYSRYMSNIFIFEPIQNFADNISNRFKANPKLKVFPSAIGNSERKDSMQLDGVGSSLFRGSNNKGIEVDVKDAKYLFDICGITKCDLLKINIEGGEFEVLPRLIETGLITSIDNLQIQFHKLSSDSSKDMYSIRHELSKTHECTWEYTWIWENWKRKAL